MAHAFDSVLMIGFGGPARGCCRKYEECPGEAFCFVHNVVGDRAGGDARIREVAEHYGHFGGVSPYSFFSQKQAGALETALEQRLIHVPVFVGYRFWTPFIKETLEEMHRAGRRKALGVILAPHRAKVSWEAYLGEVRAGREALGGNAPEVDFLEMSWYEHPDYIGATAGRIREAAGRMGAERFERARLIFTAHSIPVPMANASPYAAQIAATAARVAETLGREVYGLGYQSSPDVPPGTWLEPDVIDVIQEAAAEGVKDVVLVPIGFICDHVEVIFDLDVEAKEAAGECGMGYERAGTVGLHPEFISMLADLVAARHAEGGG
ncbi:MAG: ferrochelatase [bacterium]|nr:ferrochelatase [bacterium]